MTKADKEGQRKAPILRFKGFTDAWEQRKLNEVADIVGGGTPSTDFSEYWNGNINWFTPNEINSQIYFSESKRKISNLGLKKSSAKLLPANRSILFTSRATIGEMGILTRDATTNQGFQSLVLHNEVIPYFIFSMKSILKRQAIKKASGSTFLEISKREVEKLKIVIPSEKEQKKVSMFFKSIDNLITLYERKLKLLSRVKKYFLDNLFAEKEYPNLRFKGFTDEWEQRKLSSLFIKFTDGDWIESKNQSDSGIRLIQTGNIGVSKFINKIGSEKWISEKTLKKLNCTEIFPGDIIISRLPEPTGRACILPEFNTRMITAVDCTIARVSKNVSAEFIVQYLSTQTYFKFIQSRLAGGTRQRISRKNLADFNAFIPVIEEQKDLGLLFNLFDSIIALYENKQQHLTEIKKTLLNTMFI